MSHYYAKFKENSCVGTYASTPFKPVLCLHNNNVSGLNDQLPLYKLQMCQES